MIARSSPRRRAAPRSVQRGAETVEFALVALFYFSLIFLIVETGLLIRRYNTVGLVAHEAGRYACVTETATDATIQGYVQDRLAALGLPGATAPAITRSPTTTPNQICVAITYAYSPVSKIVTPALGALSLHKKACMPIMY